MTRFIILTTAQLLFSLSVTAQVYIEKQTRHRFAQMTLGIDYESSIGGRSTMLVNGEVATFDLPSSHATRFIIGGTHFWGHADFYIAIPVWVNNKSVNNKEVLFRRGVETVFKYYPWRIENKKVRPYIGTSILPFYLKQAADQPLFEVGPSVNHTTFPLNAGFTFNRGPHLLEAGITWNYNNKEKYYISRTQQADLVTPPLYFNVAYKFMFETTLGAEKDWESGRTKEVTEILAERGDLNNFHVSIGMSSAWWGSQGSYNKENRPFLGRYNTAIMPEFSIGYYHHQTDMSLNLAYRGYSAGATAYDITQSLKRRSVVIEGIKMLGDYHGFTPFVGPALSYERLSMMEWDGDQMFQDLEDDKIGYGVTFGWDIRPNRLQGFILRTNLRWFPNLHLKTSQGSKISFNNLEFNFIQLVLYPGRMF